MRIVFLSMYALFASVLHAQPNTITINGLLEDSAGNKLNGEFTVTVNLYTAIDSSQAVYGGTFQSVDVVSGTFAIELEMAAESNPFLLYKELWLGVKVDESAEFPLQKLTSVGYALKAQVADSLDCEQCVTEDQIADHAVTTQKLGENSVTGPAIAPGSVTSDKISTVKWDQLADRPEGLDNGDDIGIGGSGGTGYLAKFLDPSTIEQSSLYDNNGQVGIGTVSPSAKLEVDGSAKISGGLDMASSKIMNISEPTAGSDVASKAYVDALSSTSQSSGGITFFGTVQLSFTVPYHDLVRDTVLPSHPATVPRRFLPIVISAVTC